MKALQLVLLSFCLAACNKSNPPPAAIGPEAPTGRLGFDPTDLDPSVRPQDDFFHFVNGQWLKRTEIPADLTSYGTIKMLEEQTEQQLKVLIEDAAAGRGGAGSGKLGDLYTSFIAERPVEEAGVQPLAAELTRINALKTHADVSKYMGYAMSHGLAAPVQYFIERNATDPDRYLVYLWQSGLGLPDRDFYLLDTERFAAIREQYLTHIERMFNAAQWTDGAAAARVVLDLEKALAEKHWTEVQNRDRQRIYSNRFSLPAAVKLAADFDWDGVLKAGGFGAQQEFVIAQTDYFQALGGIVKGAPVANWQLYFRYRLLESYAPYLTDALVQEDFNFNGKILRGQQEIEPDWKRGVRLVSESLGELLGQAYVERHFPPAAKARMDQLIARLRDACGDSLKHLDWMSAPTKAEALGKLDKLTRKIAYPVRWKDYSSVEIHPDDLVGNIRRARDFSHRLDLEKLGKPVDRTEWDTTPQTVNAYYSPSGNEIIFPAAILQAPFFDPTADDAINFGAIGAIIGHEISHGFDDQGRKFDGDGRLRDWWSEADATRYKAEAANLVKQYNAFRPLPDLGVNGELTLGENIADLAGLVIAHRAYELALGGRPAPTVAGYTGDQRFFIAYALNWRGKIRDEKLREQLLSNPHSPYEYRVQGVLQNVPEFYAAFGVKAGDRMYLPPAERVKIW